MLPGPVVRALAVAMLLSGCPDRPPDPDLATPLRTAHTLLRAYDLDGISQERLRRRIRRGLLASSERPVDQVLLAKAIADFDPSDARERGLAVFLAGAIASRQTRLSESVAGDQGSVFVEGEMLVVMQREAEGWKIRLDRSVPVMVQEAVPSE